jgi:Concanavalin A-like lectin/glucanases superfamily
MKRIIPILVLAVLAGLALNVEASRRGLLRSSSGGGGSYSVSSAKFDGANDRISFTGSAVTYAAGKTLTTVFAVWPSNTTASQLVIQGRSGTSGPQHRIYVTASGGIQFFASDSGGTQCALANTATGLITAGQWNTVYITVDTASAGNCKIWVNGSDTSTSFTLVNTNMALDRTDIYIGADDSNGADFAGYISPIWQDDQNLAPATYHSAFFSGIAPVNVGATGSTPTGSAPDFFAQFTAGSLGVNSGADGGTGSFAGTDVAAGITFP